MPVGCYPGSFDPLTVAHLAIAEAALEQCHLDRVDLVLSVVALGKEDGHAATLDDRVAALDGARATRSWLGVRVTGAQLLADVAEGYDVLIVGADKWHQLHDVTFYGGSGEAMDAALARLPTIACAPRPPHPLPLETGVIVLDVPAWVAGVSSSAVRAGAREWLATEARTRQGPE